MHPHQLPGQGGVGGQAAKHHRQHPVAHRGGQQHGLQIQAGVKDPVAQGQSPLSQKTDGHYPAPQCAGEQKKQQPLAQQAAAPAVGDKQHEEGRRQPTQGAAEEA